MKDGLKKALAAVCAAGMLSGAVAFAAESDYTDDAAMKPSFAVVVEGTETGFYDESGAFVYPIVYKGSTYLPLRAIAGLMGKTVDWDQETETITLEGNGTAEMHTPQKKALRPADSQATVTVKTEVTVMIDGATRVFTDASGVRVYPVNFNGTTYLPVRAIGGIMGKRVGWNEYASAVFLGQQPTDAETVMINYVYGIKRHSEAISRLTGALNSQVTKENAKNNVDTLTEIQKEINEIKFLPRPDGYEESTTRISQGLATYTDAVNILRNNYTLVMNATEDDLKSENFVKMINQAVAEATGKLEEANTDLKTGLAGIGKVEGFEPEEPETDDKTEDANKTDKKA